MAEEIKTTLIALLGGGFMNGLGFFIKYLLDKRARKIEAKKGNADARKTDAEARNTDADTIQKLLDSIEELSESSLEQRDDIIKLQNVQQELVSQNKILVGQNKALVENNKKLELSISLLKDKNESLSELVISEQKEKVRFMRGVEALIVQMKEAGITEPAFKP